MSRAGMAENCLVALLLGFFLWRGFVPAWKSLNTDFRSYYIAARLYREGSSLARVYDLDWFQRQKDHLRIGPCVVNYIPATLFSALPIVPLAELPPLTAKRVWLIINAVLLALCAVALTQLTQLGWQRTLIVIFLAFEPLAANFQYGQMHLLVLALLVAALWLLRRQRPIAAGVLIATAAGLKLYPALFLAYFLRKKEWRALGGAAAGLLAVAGVSLYLFGWEVNHTYFSRIMPVIGRGEYLNPYAPEWNSLTALLHRVFILEPELNPHPLSDWPGIYAIAQPLVQSAILLSAFWLFTPGRVDREHEDLEWAALAVMLMAISTGPASYHLCLLVLPAALAVNGFLSNGRWRQAGFLTVLYGMTCLPLGHWPFRSTEGWHVFLAFPRIYPLLALLGFLYWNLYQFPAVRQRIRRNRGEALGFACLFVLLVSAGSLQAFHHRQNLFDNYSQRVFNQEVLWRKGDPAMGAEELYFTSVRARSNHFETWRRSGNELNSVLSSQDQFHPTTAAGLAAAWVELAGPVSNVARFATASPNAAPMFEIEVKNGEQPSVSFDGKWLAFIRENHGRGALWIRSLGERSGTLPATDRMVVDNTYDVWEAAFEPGNQRLVFAAAASGPPALYTVDPSTARISPTGIPGPARYPAFSPDGRWLAYSRCERGFWRLYVTSLASNAARRLTQGDCNALSPTWEADSNALVYATDCGRGFEMTTLARIEPFSTRDGGFLASTLRYVKEVENPLH